MFAILTALAAFAVAAPAGPPAYLPTELNTAGFNNATVKTSITGAAICVSGVIPVTASAVNVKLDFDVPHNQSASTKAWLDLFTAGSTYAKDIIVGKQNVSGTFNIGADLCFPPSYVSGKTALQGVHITAHGGGFDRRYWDFYPGYSYIDSAVAAGYAVLNTDRLGWGQSSTPDPLKMKQFPLDIEIWHQLVLALRSGVLADTKFGTVVGVGHSMGSILTQAVTVAYPLDFDATILTGFATPSQGQQAFLFGLDGAIGNQIMPYRFPDLPDGYLLPSNPIGVEQSFFYPFNYDPYLVQLSFDLAGGLTWGEILSSPAVGGNTTEYKNPLAVVNGLQDLVSCLSNCSYPVDQAAKVKGVDYPDLDPNKFESLLVDGAGHGVNLHYQAKGAYAWIMAFLEKQGVGA